VTPDLAKTLGLSQPRGALVADVVGESPAAKAGVQKGDVIVTFDGKDVKASRELPRLVAGTAAGKLVAVQVMRNGREISLQATLAAADEPRLAGRSDGLAPARGKLGMALQEVTPDLARSLGLKEPRGLVVSQVEPGSPAEKAGIRVGDVILEINRNKVLSLAEAQRALENGGPEGRNLFLVRRGDSQMYIPTKIG